MTTEETMERNKQHNNSNKNLKLQYFILQRYKMNSHMDQLMKRFTFMGYEIRQNSTEPEKWENLFEKCWAYQQRLWTYQQLKIIVQYSIIKTTMQTKIVVKCLLLLGTIFASSVHPSFIISCLKSIWHSNNIF